MRRTIKAILKRSFFKKDRLNAKVPNATFHVSIGFICAFSLVMLSLMVGWLSYFYPTPGDNNILVVNAPDSYIEYLNDGTGSKYKYGKIVHTKYTEAYYDFITIGRWMRENDAFMAIVFPTDFDMQIRIGQTPDVLTYYLSDELEYSEWKDYIKDNHLDPYKDFLKRTMNIPAQINPEAKVIEDGRAIEKRSGAQIITRNLARNFFPLIAFIVILYLAMSSGTNAISGQKEQGTFTAVIMTPAPRSAIILGNLLGVFLTSFFPSAICMSLLFLIRPYRSLGGLLASLLLLASLSLLISAITILISVMNDNVVSAQTAFLPIFLVLIACCVSSMQEGKNTSRLFDMIPVYGHFYGLGKCLINEFSFLDVAVCVLVSVLCAVLCTVISVKLISLERFIVASDVVTRKELAQARRMKAKKDYVQKPRGTIFGYRPSRKIPLTNFISDQILYPFALLSVFQMIAVIPTVVRFMRKPEYSDYILDLKDVSGVGDIVKQSFDVMGIFMSDPLFLFLMGIGYVLIIDMYIRRVMRKERNPLSTIGLPFVNVAKRYLSGLLLRIVMMGSVFGLLLLSGRLRITGFGIAPEYIPLFIAYVFMWIPQGATEEIMFRGFMMSRSASRFGIPVAIFFQAVLFAVFHGMNMGFTWLAGVNLVLIALFFGLLAYYSDNIWMTCGAHTCWNFTQGNLFGLQVSGNGSAASLISTEFSARGEAYITGGDFGPEGSIFVTIVSLTAIAAVIVWYKVILPRKTPSVPTK